MGVIKNVCHFVADNDNSVKCEKHDVAINNGKTYSLCVARAVAKALNKMQTICMGVFG